MSTESDLREAYAHLAENAPRISDLHLVTGDGTSPQPRRRLAIVASTVAAAAVAAVVAVNLSAGGTHRSNLPSGTSPQIVCAPTGRAAPSAGQLESDRHTIADRLRRLGVTGGTVELDSADQLIITAPGLAAADAAGLCTQHPLELRPLVAPGVENAGSAATSTDPLAHLPFSPPTSETAYIRLSPAQRHLIATALAHARCGSLTSASTATDTDLVACDTGDYRNPVTVLLGPAILTEADVATATPLAPDASSGSTEWTVQISLKPAGHTAWTAYTAAHNTAGTSNGGAAVTACAPARTPCADFVAPIVNGTPTAVPLTAAVTTAPTIEISGRFSQESATAAAAQIASGPLAVPLRNLSSPSATASPTSRPS